MIEMLTMFLQYGVVYCFYGVIKEWMVQAIYC